MEKRRPSYDLDAVKRVLGSSDTLAMTTTAFKNATDLGFDEDDVALVIRSLRSGMFVKSIRPSRTIASGRMFTMRPHEISFST